MIRVLLGLLCCFFVGCATDEAITLSDGEQSLAEIKKAIVGVMGDPRRVSENQREFTSQYFSKKADPSFDPEKSKERMFATMLVLGARRPYDIEIRAFVEKKIGKHYELSGEDTPTAKKLAKELKEKLNQSRDGRNIIDDFHAF